MRPSTPRPSDAGQPVPPRSSAGHGGSEGLGDPALAVDDCIHVHADDLVAFVTDFFAAMDALNGPATRDGQPSADGDR